MPPLGRFRSLLKRTGRRVKNVFNPSDQASPSHTPSRVPSTPTQVIIENPPPQPTPIHPPPQLPSQSQPAAIQTQQASSLGQPALAPSLLAANGDQTVNAESRLTLVAKKAGQDAWAALKVSLRLLEKSSDVFPPVKSAVGGFLGVVDIFETAAQNRRDYAELALNLRTMVEEFKEQPGEHTSSKMSEALTAMASGLEEELNHVEEQQLRSGVRRHLEAGEDAEDVQGCYRRVETLCRELQNKALLKIWRNQEDQQVDARLEKLKGALQAMYDSSLADVVGRRTCTPGTRQAILTGIRNWADDPTGPKVYWLNGMAGTGKTTLAYSFCEQMQLERRLGASFFCSRTDEDSRNVSKIVPTIAHQLARLSPSYREVLIRQLDEDKDIGARRTEIQFEKLIRAPLRRVEADALKGIVIAIDALDECDRRDGARDILNVLLNAGDLPIKFFVTCRPEPGLYSILQSKDKQHRSVLHLHDIEASFVQADIKTYLEAELAETSLPLERLQMLAERAGTLFIYAATAVRYIYPKNRDVDVHRRLEHLLSITSKAKATSHRDIDRLYTAVLAAPLSDEGLDNTEKTNIRMVLDTAICAREPMTVTTMKKLLGLDSERDVTLALQHLRSVLNVSEATNLISTFHASFPDFMLDRDRSEKLCCNVEEHSRLLVLGCFGAMRRLLRFNICGLESSFVLDESIPNLARKVEEAIAPELFYACRYWGNHLMVAQSSNNVHSELRGFLSNRLLFWMEVLNLRKCIGAGAQALAQAHAWLQRSGGANDMVDLAYDAGRFATSFGSSAASRSTPHIYISALPFWPPARPVRQQYWKRLQGSTRLEGAALKRRDLSCLAVWETDRVITCVAHSPDGTHIASGSWGNTVCVWDAHSGDLVAGPFEGHTEAVVSVGFSPDGARIVSGSRDETIRVWDAHSGNLVAGPFEGHTRLVSSVGFSPDGTRIVSGSHDDTIRARDARDEDLVSMRSYDDTKSDISVGFSPDGTRIVSGSNDNTVCVWDAHSGELVAGPFGGHTESVVSVGFSPDGTLIVSSSRDTTIRVWDAYSGDLVAGPFEGHTSWVNSVSFSPDGTRIVSGSHDETIRVWDAHSGDLVAGPFEGHAERVISVGFSPDGNRIVSGSWDKTIRVWDARSGDLVAGPFEGHTEMLNYVGFSPDGTRIVSSANDNTIRVWDAHSEDLAVGPFEGHAGSVSSVGFSPDGTRIVSGSDDNTVCVWDAHSGDLVAGPFEGHTRSVVSVGFSPDGTRIVSSSWDWTIRVWDAHTGDLVAGPCEGHTGLVSSVGFSPDGTHIVSGSWDKTIRVWDSHTGDLVAGPFNGHTESVASVGFSPDGTRIVSGSQDYTIRVWDARSGDLVAGPFKGHATTVSSVGFSPDGTRIVSGSYDCTIRVWDAHSGDLVAGPIKGHTDVINSVGFSPDGIHIVSGSRDKTIRVWDAHTGDLVVGPFKGHTNEVNSVGFSPDGARIISGSVDTTIRVYTTTPLAGRFKDWGMDKTGMVITRQGQRLVHVPRDLWTGVMWSQNTICIHAKGMVRLDFDDALLGEEWRKCYRC